MLFFVSCKTAQFKRMLVGWTLLCAAARNARAQYYKRAEYHFKHWNNCLPNSLQNNINWRDLYLVESKHMLKNSTWHHISFLIGDVFIKKWIWHLPNIYCRCFKEQWLIHHQWMFDIHIHYLINMHLKCLKRPCITLTIPPQPLLFYSSLQIHK